MAVEAAREVSRRSSARHTIGRGLVLLLCAVFALSVGVMPARAMDPVARGLAASATPKASLKRDQIIRALTWNPAVSPLITNPPTVTAATNGTGSIASTVDATKTCLSNNSIGITDSRVTTTGAPLLSSGGFVFKGQSIQYSAGVRKGNFIVSRFLYEGSKLQVCFLANGQRVFFRIDGKFYAPNAPTTGGNPTDYTPGLLLRRDQSAELVTLDFGANTPTIYATGTANDGFAAGGSGYALDDVITLAGGTCTRQPKIKVTGLNVTAAFSGAILDVGACSVQPSNPIAQASTTGVGTGATINLTWSASHSTRATHRIEVIVDGNTNQDAQISGIEIAPTDTVLAWPSATPKYLVFGDSLVGNTYADYPTGGKAYLTGQFLGLDNIFVSGLGGSGWEADNGQYSTAQRLQNDICNQAPDILVIDQGYNDKSAVAATLQADVTSDLQSIMACLPAWSAVFVVGPHLDNHVSATPASTISNAIKNGAAAAVALYPNRIAYIDPVAENVNVGGGGDVVATTGVGNSDFCISSDALHATEWCHTQRWATWESRRIYEAAQAMLLTTTH